MKVYLFSIIALVAFSVILQCGTVTWVFEEQKAFGTDTMTVENEIDGTYMVISGNGTGKNILKYGQAKIVPPEATELFAISAELENPDVKYSEKERQMMQDRIDFLQEQLYTKVPQMNAETESFLEKQREIFRDYLTEKMSNKSEIQMFRHSLPFITLGIDGNEQALKFGFLEDNLTDERVKKYFEQIRAIVGGNINIVITSQKQPKAASCVGKSLYCDSLIDGAKIELSPLRQFKSGVPAQNVQCDDGLQLMIKSSNGYPICIKPLTASKLLQIGWVESTLILEEGWIDRSK